MLIFLVGLNYDLSQQRSVSKGNFLIDKREELASKEQEFSERFLMAEKQRLEM